MSCLDAEENFNVTTDVKKFLTNWNQNTLQRRLTVPKNNNNKMTSLLLLKFKVLQKPAMVHFC